MNYLNALFTYERRVSFSDTDAMGVAHHANYLRYCEETRVAWMRSHNLTEQHYPARDLCLAVIESRLRHLRPVRFEDLVKVYLQVRRDRLKIHFQYAMVRKEEPEAPVAFAETVLVPLNRELKPIRMPVELAAQLEKEIWTETWL